jgi:hypothetical protein
MLSMRAILYLRDGGPADLPIPAVSPRLHNAVLFTPLLSPPSSHPPFSLGVVLAHTFPYGVSFCTCSAVR